MRKRYKIVKEMIALEEKVEADRRILKLLQYTEPYDEIQLRMRNNMCEHLKLGNLLLKKDLIEMFLVLSMGIIVIGSLTYVSIRCFKKGNNILGVIDSVLTIFNIFTSLKLSGTFKDLYDMYKHTKKLINEHEKIKSLQNNQTTI